MASKSLISRNTRFSKFCDHVRRWAFERTKDDPPKIVMRARTRKIGWRHEKVRGRSCLRRAVPNDYVELSLCFGME